MTASYFVSHDDDFVLPLIIKTSMNIVDESFHGRR
jgi:hypothetical protein